MALLYSQLFEGLSVPPWNYLTYSGFRKTCFTLNCVLSKSDIMETDVDFSSRNTYIPKPINCTIWHR